MSQGLPSGVGGLEKETSGGKRLGREDCGNSLEKEAEQKGGCINYAPLELRMRLDS